jgi:hypothetical protein
MSAPVVVIYVIAESSPFVSLFYTQMYCIDTWYWQNAVYRWNLHLEIEMFQVQSSSFISHFSLAAVKELFHIWSLPLSGVYSLYFLCISTYLIQEKSLRVMTVSLELGLTLAEEIGHMAKFLFWNMGACLLVLANNVDCPTFCFCKFHNCGESHCLKFKKGKPEYICLCSGMSLRKLHLISPCLSFRFVCCLVIDSLD